MILNRAQADIHVPPVALASGFDVHSHLSRSAEQVRVRLLPRCHLGIVVLSLIFTVLPTVAQAASQGNHTKCAA